MKTQLKLKQNLPDLASPGIEPADDAAVLGKEGWLGVLQASFHPMAPTAEAAQALLRLAKPLAVKRGDQLLSREQHADKFWLLLSGRVAMGLAETGQMMQQTRDIVPGQWIDNASALLGEEACYLEDALVEKDALVVSFACSDYLRCGAKHPSLTSGLAAVLAERVSASLSTELSLIRQSIAQRLANWLLSHVEAGAQSGSIVLRQRKRAIASQLGTTPETLSRVLRMFITAGVIRVRGYTIDLLEIDSLRALAAARR